ncbi:hypothetical protein [uncultured Nisaea sp.]|uniref:hypothetical protein n=1 Tax=uncultured Nisaea sp. TaxID=538215 RepID=UPI0030ECF394|tara:strand:+ start:847 stop:1554 length:708 start_codon:yes stop_codon:yes gene_type:complete
MAFAERMDSGFPDEPRMLETGTSAPSGAGGLQMHSFGFWQQGVAPGDWSHEVIARNLEGEDFKGYRRASDPSCLRDTSPYLPETTEVLPDEIVVETGRLVPAQASEETIAAVGRLVAAYGEDTLLDRIDGDALVQPARTESHGADLYGIELVDTVAGAARRAGLEGSPMYAAMRGMDASRAAPEDGLVEAGLHRRVTDLEADTTSATAEAGLLRFGQPLVSGQPLIQSADDFLML